jgi:hypothetical protein
MAVEGCHAALFHAAQGSRLVAVVGLTVVQVISQASASANPEVVLAMIEDYRAGYQRSTAREGRPSRRRPSTVAPAGAVDDSEDLYGDPLVIWRHWADDVRATASTLGTTWPRRHPPHSLRRWATSSPLGRDGLQRRQRGLTQI